MTSPRTRGKAALEAYARTTRLPPERRDALWDRIEASVDVPRGRSRRRSAAWWAMAAGIAVAVATGAWLGGWQPEAMPPRVGQASVEAAYEALPEIVDGVTEARRRARLARAAGSDDGTSDRTPEPAGASSGTLAGGQSPEVRSSLQAPRRREPTPSARSDLAAEMRFLHQARAAVRGKAFADALRHVQSHRAAFPSGQLREDLSALEIRALCGLGRDREARSRALEFGQRHPHSAHAVVAGQPCGPEASRP